jgi:hypothetical protein
MKKFEICEKITIAREITVEAESMEEVQEKYENGDYNEELESCYFDGQYDNVKCKIKEMK